MRALLPVLAIAATNTVEAQVNNPIINQLQKQVRNRNTPKQTTTPRNNNPRNNNNTRGYVCGPNTTAIEIHYYNASIQNDKPYTITAGPGGLSLDIDGHFSSRYFSYQTTDFDRILQKVNDAKLRKTETHGDPMVGGGSLTFTIINKDGPNFTVKDADGEKDYEGDLYSVVRLIREQIPNLSDLLWQDEYYDPTQEEEELFYFDK